MSRRISVSRASRLVGVKRGVLQNKIRAGELKAFEGHLLLTDLLQAYPKTTVDDSSMLERVEQIMEQASFKNAPAENHRPSNEVVASRVLELSQKLADKIKTVQRYEAFAEKIKVKLRALKHSKEKLPKDMVLFLEFVDEAVDNLENRETHANESFGNEVFLRIMTAQASILPSGHEFFIEGSGSILDSGLRGGLALNYGCSNGNCGLCKMRLVSGEIQRTRPHDFVLTEAEKGLGYFLGCSNTALSDVVLEADEAGSEFDIPQQSIDLRIKKIEHSDSPIVVINTKTPRTNRLRFLAGQQVSLSIDGVGTNTYFIASCPCDDMNIQFHINSNDSNVVSKHLCATAKINESITITGPIGSFTLNEDSSNSLVFMVQGNGFAPVKGLIEHAMALDVAEHIYLYWLSDIEGKHYLNNLCRSWNDALDNLHFTKLPLSKDGRSIELISQLVMENHNSVKNFDYYICGENEFNIGVSEILQQRSVSDCHILCAEC
jgi:CDP-4-dehydro-6-deoxyglucose reductase